MKFLNMSVYNFAEIFCTDPSAVMSTISQSLTPVSDANDGAEAAAGVAGGV